MTAILTKPYRALRHPNLQPYIVQRYIIKPSKGEQMTIPYWLRPAYRTLRHPPEDSLAYQLAYVLIAVGAIMSFWVHDANHIETLLAVFASAFAVSGSLVGWACQFKGFWSFERGAIWAIWGGLVIRSFVVISISDASVHEISARVGVLLAVCALLIPRYRSIQGADLDPRK